MKKPRIGIPPYFNYDSGEEYMPEGYLRAVECVHGELVTIHYDTPPEDIPALAGSLDGLILSGGVDVDPRCYGQEPSPRCGRINPIRDRLELTLLQNVLGTSLPILAICRGIQILNVAMGGTLIQDIPSAFPGAVHEQQNGRLAMSHRVRLVPGGFLSGLFSGADTLLTNSFHHQAVDSLAEGLLPEAYAEEGFLEACRGKGPQWILGVQWHPEITQKTDPASLEIFNAFGRAISGV